MMQRAPRSARTLWGAHRWKWVVRATSLLAVGMGGTGCASDRFQQVPSETGTSSDESSGAVSTAVPSAVNGSNVSPAATMAQGGLNAGESSNDDATDGTNSTDASSVGAGAVELNGAPLVFAPTPTSFSVSVVIASGELDQLSLVARVAGSESWGEPVNPQIRASDAVEWLVEELEPNTAYEYELSAHDAQAGSPRVLFSGKARTARPPGESFSFAMVSDTHIGANLTYSNQGDELVYAAICSEIEADDPDFLINLGDLLDYHEFGFNMPPPSAAISRSAYLNYRAAMGNLAGKVAHFGVVGNWDGENGEFSTEQIARSRDTRMVYAPNPNPTTYPEGGSPSQDYYAFTWGDALFVVLNVMTYTTTAHVLVGEGEAVDDWTLGAQQLAWLRSTLTQSQARWKFTFIHHTVGGNAGNLANSAYGRGGGRAAHVGEQAEIHQMMLDTGATIFFHGHDHVFVDMEVDGLHYSDPGSAGAPWKFETAETGYETYWTESGWSRVNVSPEQVHVEFIALGGTLLHEYRVTK